MIRCPACGFDSADEAEWCDFCKEPFRKKAKAVEAAAQAPAAVQPPLQDPIALPPVQAGPVAPLVYAPPVPAQPLPSIQPLDLKLTAAPTAQKAESALPMDPKEIEKLLASDRVDPVAQINTTRWVAIIFFLSWVIIGIAGIIFVLTHKHGPRRPPGVSQPEQPANIAPVNQPPASAPSGQPDQPPVNLPGGPPDQPPAPIPSGQSDQPPANNTGGQPDQQPSNPPANLPG